MNIAYYINPGDVELAGRDRLNKLVKEELTSNRFYHENKNDNKEVYLYSANSYVNFDLTVFCLYSASW